MGAPSDDKQRQNEAVRRVVGIAALRKLRRMVDEDSAQTAARQTRGRLFLAGILIATTLGLAFLLRDIIFA